MSIERDSPITEDLDRDALVAVLYDGLLPAAVLNQVIPACQNPASAVVYGGFSV